MRKFRIKRVVYSDNTKEYIIQKRYNGFFWHDYPMYKSTYLLSCYDREIVTDGITENYCIFHSLSENNVYDVIKWLSMSNCNECIINKNGDIYFGFLKKGTSWTYYLNKTYDEAIKLKKEYYPNNFRSIVSKDFIYYNIEDNSFFK